MRRRLPTLMCPTCMRASASAHSVQDEVEARHILKREASEDNREIRLRVLGSLSTIAVCSSLS